MKDVPGPGSYDPLTAVNKDRVIAYKMGSSSNREDIVNRDAN